MALVFPFCLAGVFLLDVCLIVFLFVVCYCLVMILFNRKYKQLQKELQKDVEGLSSSVSDVRDDLKVLGSLVRSSGGWNCFVGFVLGEARFSDRWDAFVIPTGGVSLFNVWRDSVSVGELKWLVADAGYDFSKLVLRRSVDVTDCLRALSCGGSLGAFVDEDVLKVRVKS